MRLDVIPIVAIVEDWDACSLFVLLCAEDKLGLNYSYTWHSVFAQSITFYREWMWSFV